MIVHQLGTSLNHAVKHDLRCHNSRYLQRKDITTHFRETKTTEMSLSVRGTWREKEKVKFIGITRAVKRYKVISRRKHASLIAGNVKYHIAEKHVSK